MINVYVQCDNKQDATSWYRAWGTFPDMERRYPIKFHDLLTAFPPHPTLKGQSFLDWTKAQYIDVALFQRSVGNVLGYAQTLKELGVPIWYDLDDNLWEIPDTFAIKKGFNAKTLQSVEDFILLADLVTVSTQALADYIKDKVGVECVVVNNAIDLTRYPIHPFNIDGPTIWRGSGTHKDDLELCREFIEGLEHIEFWGYDPTTNAPRLKTKSHSYVKPIDPSLYYKTLAKRKPSFVLCPLVDDVFNRCKSNVSYLEATISGAVSINNQVGEFKGKGLPFVSEVEANELAEVHKVAALDVIQNYNLSQANDKRIKEIGNILLKGLDMNT